jgi:hypothetical protein
MEGEDIHCLASSDSLVFFKNKQNKKMENSLSGSSVVLKNTSNRVFVSYLLWLNMIFYT